MGIKLLARGKVREIYGNTEEQHRCTNTDLNYDTQHYIIDGRVVLDKITRAVMGFLFDDNELERIAKLTKQSEREVDMVLSTMFLGYPISNCGGEI